MYVYIVFKEFRQMETEHIIAVFSTEVLAQACIDKTTEPDSHFIEPFVVDDPELYKKYAGEV